MANPKPTKPRLMTVRRPMRDDPLVEIQAF
jgi:hypothetical protein